MPPWGPERSERWALPNPAPWSCGLLPGGMATPCPGLPAPFQDPDLPLPGGPHPPQPVRAEPGENGEPLAPVCGQRPGPMLPVTPHPSRGRACPPGTTHQQVLGRTFLKRGSGVPVLDSSPTPTPRAAQTIQGPQAGGHHSPCAPIRPALAGQEPSILGTPAWRIG